MTITDEAVEAAPVSAVLAFMTARIVIGTPFTRLWLTSRTKASSS